MTGLTKTQNEILDRTRPPKSGPPRDIPFPDYFDTILENGINLLVIENYKIPAVSVRLVFKNAGSYFDEENYGTASVTAELLTKGTKSRSATQIAEDIDFLGGNLSAGSDWDGSYISLSVLRKYLNEGIDILSDTVLNPVFSEEEITRVKEQRIASIIQGKDDPGTLSDRMFNRAVFENSPYAYPHEGTEESIAKIQRSGLLDFYKTHYLPSNLILAFVGAISKEEAIDIVTEKFAKWNVKTTGGNESQESEVKNKPKVFSENHIYIVDKPGAVQSNLKIGHIGIERNNPDFIAVTLMNTALGGYFSSRININLREKHGYTYGARSGFSPRIFPGEFSVETDVRNEVTDASVKLISEELKRITSEEITDEELQLVKNYLTGLFPLQLETANAVATRVINLKLYNLPKNYYSTYISNINKLTKGDVLRAAKKYIHPDNLYIIVSGNSDAVKEKLSNIKPVEIYDADGNPIN